MWSETSRQSPPHRDRKAGCSQEQGPFFGNVSQTQYLLVNEPHRHMIGAIKCGTYWKNQWKPKPTDYLRMKMEQVEPPQIINNQLSPTSCSWYCFYSDLFSSIVFQIAPATFPTNFSCPASISSARVRQQVALVPGQGGEVQHHPMSESCVVPGLKKFDVNIHGWMTGKI